MHCTACDTTLNDFELSRTYADGVPVDLCNTCYSFIGDDVDTSADLSLMNESDNIDVYDDSIESYIDYDVDVYDMYSDRELN